MKSREAAVGRGATDNYSYINFRDEEEKIMLELEQYLVHCKNNEFDQADKILKRVLDSQLVAWDTIVDSTTMCCARKEKMASFMQILSSTSISRRINREVLQTVTVKEYRGCGHTRIPYRLPATSRSAPRSKMTPC